MADTLLGIGSEAQQRARLSHLLEAHGFELRVCPGCHDVAPIGCETCQGLGCVFKAGRLEPCGAACQIRDVRPA